jgi:hypothetical protein
MVARAAGDGLRGECGRLIAEVRLVESLAPYALPNDPPQSFDELPFIANTDYNKNRVLRACEENCR